MDLGYTRQYRKMWDNPVLLERGKRYSRLEAWLDIVNRLAAGVDQNGLKRGEFIASQRFLAERWNWSKTTVKRFMQDLQAADDPMISKVDHQTDHQTDHFIVCKYETYNPTRTTSRTTSRTKINKRENKSKNNKNISSQAGACAVDQLPSSESFRLSKRLQDAIAVRDPNSKAAKLPDLTHWASDIDKLLRIDNRRVEDCEAVIDWCQREDCFWAPNVLSGRKLREKFDTLWGQLQRENNGNGHGTSRGYKPDRTGAGEDQDATPSDPKDWPIDRWVMFARLHDMKTARALMQQHEVKFDLEKEVQKHMEA